MRIETADAAAVTARTARRLCRVLKPELLAYQVP